MNTQATTRRQSPKLNVSAMGRQADKAESLLKALASKPRLMILCNLSTGEKSVGELLNEVELSPSAMSQHLALLREQGLVSTRRQAQTIFYSLEDGPALDIISILYSTYCKPRRKRRSSRKN